MVNIYIWHVKKAFYRQSYDQAEKQSTFMGYEVIIKLCAGLYLVKNSNSVCVNGDGETVKQPTCFNNDRYVNSTRSINQIN